eukprot:7641132-Pyramimonas_sp.AAC.1
MQTAGAAARADNTARAAGGEARRGAGERASQRRSARGKTEGRAEGSGSCGEGRGLRGQRSRSPPAKEKPKQKPKLTAPTSSSPNALRTIVSGRIRHQESEAATAKRDEAQVAEERVLSPTSPVPTPIVSPSSSPTRLTSLPTVPPSPTLSASMPKTCITPPATSPPTLSPVGANAERRHGEEEEEKKEEEEEEEEEEASE